MAETIAKFVREFEARFKSILMDSAKDHPAAKYTRFGEIFPPRMRFSDWDLGWHLKEHESSVEAIKEIDSFIRDFKGFSDVGVLLAFSEQHKCLYQHVDYTDVLQFLTFMPDQTTAPFVDIHVKGPIGNVLTSIYECLPSREFVDLAMIIAWRKIRNGNDSHARAMLQNFILPSFPAGLHNEIESDPVGFFENQLGGSAFKQTVSFLKAPNSE